jgi:hypothetical protein
MQFQTNLVHQRQLPSFPQNVVPFFGMPQYPAPTAWELTPQYAPAPVQTVPLQEGMSFGTFLAIGTTVVSAAVLFDSKASKEAKALAQMALGASVPFLLNKAFDLQAWPGQQWN